MNEQEIELEGRKYLAYVSPDAPPGAYVIIGPPEGLVDALELPEPLATRFHNILYARRIFSYKDASKTNVLLGVWQEALAVDVQRVVEKFIEFEKESV